MYGNNNQNFGYYMPVQPAGYGYGYGNGGGLLGATRDCGSAE